jgi:hypothetical protein
MVGRPPDWPFWVGILRDELQHDTAIGKALCERRIEALEIEIESNPFYYLGRHANDTRGIPDIEPRHRLAICYIDFRRSG